MGTPKRFRTLAAWREAHGYTQADAAARLGVTQAAYGRYEQGRVPRPAILRKLAQLTGVPLAVLTGMEVG